MVEMTGAMTVLRMNGAMAVEANWTQERKTNGYPNHKRRRRNTNRKTTQWKTHTHTHRPYSNIRRTQEKRFTDGIQTLHTKLGPSIKTLPNSSTFHCEPIVWYIYLVIELCRVWERYQVHWLENSLSVWTCIHLDWSQHWRTWFTTTMKRLRKRFIVTTPYILWFTYTWSATCQCVVWVPRVIQPLVATLHATGFVRIDPPWWGWV